MGQLLRSLEYGDIENEDLRNPIKRRPLYIADSIKVALYIGNWALGSPCISLFVDNSCKCLELVVSIYSQQRKESTETHVPTPWYDLKV